MTRAPRHRWSAALAVVLLAAAGGGLAALAGEDMGVVTLTPNQGPDDRAALVETALQEFEQAQQLQATDADRAEQLFRSAAQRFEAVIAAGVVNGRLEFNLGNCLLQAGDLGGAIVHYRRAARLIPGDARVADNLALARSRCLTDIPPSRRNQVLRNLFFWHYDLAVRQRRAGALASFAAIWVLLLVGNWFAPRKLRIAAAVAAVVALALAGSVAVGDWQAKQRPPGVVLAMDVSVYKGPGTGYGRQFEQPLQPGVEFVRIGERGSWYEIELADGHTGWIEAKTAELVPL